MICSSASGTSSRNLLIATRWTSLLSLIAFIGGGIVGLILLFMRTSQIAAAANGSPRSTSSSSRARRC